MRYKRSAGNSSIFVLIAVIAALIVGLGMPGTAHAVWQYGIKSTDAAGTASTNVTRDCYMTLVAPNTANMRIIAVANKAGTTGTQRLGIYFDTDAVPDGATLQADTGQVTANTAGVFNYFAVGPVDLPANQNFGIAWINNGGTGSYYYHGAPPQGDETMYYYANRGVTITTAYPATFPTGATTYTQTYGQQVLYVLYPTISSTTATINDAQTYSITGAGFETLDQFNGTSYSPVYAGTTSKVYLSPTDNFNDGGRVLQTISTWTGDTSVSYTVVKGSLNYGPVYLFVENSDGQHNASGYPVILQNPTTPLTTTGTLTVTGNNDSSISVMATYTGDDAGGNGLNNCVIEYKKNGDVTWLLLTASVNRTNKEWTATANGLLPGTGYDFQATFTDPDSPISGTNPLTLTNTPTTYTGIGVGTVTTGATTDTSVVVNAPVDAVSDTNSNATVLYQYNPNGTGWQNFGGAVAAKTNTSMNITGLTPGTNYDFRVTWTDANGVYNMTTKASLGTPYVSNSANQSTTSAGTTVGALTAPSIGGTTVDLSAAFTGDTNTNNSVVFEYKEASSGTWLPGPSGTLGSGKWTCQVTGLTPVTSYNFRATFTDGDGLYGTNPSTLNTSTNSGCDAIVDDCMDCHAMPPAAGSHEIVSHQGDSSRSACAVCHYDYTTMTNVTSTARWTTGHTNDVLDIYTSNHVNNGITGGYYSGYRNASTLWEDGTANSNNTCSVTYCHGTGASPTWGATGTLTCTSCHNNPPVDVGSHATHSQGYVGYLFNTQSFGQYDYGCYVCHPEATHAQGPATGTSAAYVAFNSISSPVTLGGTYNVGALLGTDSGGKKVSAATCTNALYCHSNGAGGNANETPAWGSALATGCSACHGGKTTMSSGNHAAHLNQGFLGVFGCVDCHNQTVSNDTTVSDKSAHVNGIKEIGLAGSGWYDETPKTCINTDCHNTGQATPTDVPPSWGGTFTCDGCHGAEGSSLVAGAPEYANNTSVSNTRNGHWVPGHVAAATDCIDCHNSTVDAAGAIKSGSVHLDGSRQVAFTAAIGGTYTPATKTCSGTAAACHGAVTPKWGGVLACLDCHIDSGAIGVETDDYTYGNATKATINNLEWTNAGHGRTSGLYPMTNNTAANLVCEDCHDGSVAHNTASNPFRIKNYTTPDALCLGCHDGVTAVAASNHDFAHVGQGTWTWTPKCIDCHDPHGDNGGVTTAQYNRTMIHSQVAVASTGTHGVPGTKTNVDFPTGFGASRTWAGYVDSTSPYNAICQVCHTTALYFNQSTYTAGHNNTQPCVDCHSHPTGFQPAGSCIDCHGTGGAGTLAGKRNIETDFTSKSHHIRASSWSAIDPISCTACHVEGNFADGSIVSAKHKDATVQLKQWTGSFPVAGNNGTFTEVAYSTEASLTPVCLGCHNATNASAQPFAASGDSTNPSAYDVASGGTGAGTVAERYNAAGTTPFSKYVPTNYNVVPQINKAYSPHGNASGNERGVALTTAWADDGGSTNVACTDCHNTHGSTVGGAGEKMNSYSSIVGGWRGGLLKSTSTYTPAAGSGAPVTWSASADLCWDCHLGDDVNAPKDYNTGFNNGAPISGYYDAGRWRSADTWQPSHTYKTAGTGNGAGSQKGGHFGKSSNLQYQPSGSISGRCTVCHDPHGVLPGKTNAAYMVPALKGTWMTSPYKEDRAPDGYTTLRPTGNTYEFRWQNRRNLGPARMSPRFDVSSPPIVGGGYGTGVAATTWGKGGTGAYGYFIDDNTFGTSVTYATGATITDQNMRSGWYPGTASVTHNTITETSTQFAGLCLTSGCHTQANLVAVTSSNGTDSVEAHKTVKGWGASGTSDLFKGNQTMNHMMAWYTTSTSTSSMQCTLTTSTVSYVLPAGYRWSVDPGTEVIRPTSNPTVPPNTTDGQKQVGFVQQQFHSFPCSKCHTAHTSKLPRLMKTNCIDVGTSNSYPIHSGTAYTYTNCATGATNISTTRLYTMTCHNTRKSNQAGGGGWNIITGW